MHRPKDKNKLYGLHAPEVECISKGKARAPYEFGVKVTVTTTLKEDLVVGMRSMPGHPWDGHTLAETIEQVSILADQKPTSAPTLTTTTAPSGPPEMFFGRRKELAQLRGVKSLGVLYGGRRLGKSSLLDQIERETRSAQGSEALYVSMETVNTSSDHVVAAWEFVYRASVTREVINQMDKSRGGRWQVTQGWIEKELVNR